MRTSFRLLAAAAATSLSALSLAACSQGGASGGGESADLSNGLQIVTTTTQVTDFVTELTRGLDGAGLKVEITPLLSAGESAHSYEATPADLTAMGAADVVVESGMGLEPWLEPALQSAGFHGTLIDSSAGFDPESLHAGHDDAADASAAPDASETPAEDGHDHEGDDAHASESAEPADSAAADDHDHAEDGHDGHDHGDGPNPHLWMAPAGAESMVSAIADGLAAVDPAHAEAIRANAASYTGKLESLTTWISDNVDTVPEAERTIVTNHDALEYFTEQFHIDQVGTIIPSWDDAAEPSAADIDELIRKMKEHHVTAIFSETQLSPATAETIASQTGAKVYSGEDALYTDALGAAGTPEGTYLGAQIHNVRIIMESWNRTAGPLPADLEA